MKAIRVVYSVGIKISDLILTAVLRSKWRDSLGSGRRSPPQCHIEQEAAAATDQSRRCTSCPLRAHTLGIRGERSSPANALQIPLHTHTHTHTYRGRSGDTVLYTIVQQRLLWAVKYQLWKRELTQHARSV